MSELTKRTLSALVLFLCFLGAIFTCEWAFNLFFLGVIFFLSYEWQGLLLPKLSRNIRVGIAAISVLSFYFFPLFLWAVLLLLIAMALWGWAMKKGQLKAAGLSILGILYFAFFFWVLKMLRFDFEAGKLLLFLAFVMIWSVDIGAYFVGRFVKGPKIAPKISPSKTWSGLVGGMIAVTVIFYMAAHLFVLSFNPIIFYLMPLIAVIAQAGDFFESYLKRRIGVKDSGHIIPGHGGVLDRFDGALLAIPVFYGLLLILYHSP